MSCGFKTFISLGKRLPVNISRIIEGDHGIGKSQGVHQIGKELDLSVMDIRLALMTDGDFIGIPEIVDIPFVTGKKEKAYQDDLKNTLEGLSAGAATEIAKSVRAKWNRKSKMRFAPPEFLIEACLYPRIVFLDEFNRATNEVKQAAFQLVLDRNVNGHYLHPESIVFAAINTGMQYHVDALDPALYDRFAVIKLEPSIDDWLEWARPKLHPAIVDFINQFPDHLEHKDEIESYKVYPSRRSWERFDESMKGTDLTHVSSNDDVHEYVFSVAASLIGTEAAIAFTNFVKTLKKNVTVNDILDEFEDIKERIDTTNYDTINGLIERLSIHCKENLWSETQIENFAKFQAMLDPELVITAWRKLVDANPENAKKVHSINKMFILECLGDFTQNDAN
jgi:MoxR-like ATPase